MAGVPDPVYFSEPAELRAWLDANAGTAGEVWVALPKKASGLRGLTWTQIVEEALCVGWIDSVSRPIDEQWRMQRISPRKPGSIWSAVNVAHVERLSRE